MAAPSLPPNPARFLCHAFAHIHIPGTSTPAFKVGEDYQWNPCPEIGSLGIVTCRSEYTTTPPAITEAASLMVYGDGNAKGRAYDAGAYTVTPVQFAVFTWKRRNEAATAALLKAYAAKNGIVLQEPSLFNS